MCGGHPFPQWLHGQRERGGPEAIYSRKQNSWITDGQLTPLRLSPSSLRVSWEVLRFNAFIYNQSAERTRILM